jgi:hypothetical protein
MMYYLMKHRVTPQTKHTIDGQISLAMATVALARTPPCPDWWREKKKY